MSTVNKRPPAPPIRTHEGAPAVRIGADQELRRTLMACMLWEDSFYESGQDVGHRISELVKEVEPATCALLAIEARTAMKLRHAPLWVAVGLARRRWAPLDALLSSIIQRPDELTEFLALYWKDKRQPLTAAMKRGLAAAFRKFDAYRLAKYNRDGAVKLRDVMFLVHPEPLNDEQAATWKALADGTLAAPDTWEVALSSGADKRETWERLIGEGKLGGLALLRNLRNMEQAAVPDVTIRGALNSMQVGRILPFRFLAAARHAPRFEPELEGAMFRACEGIPKLPGKTVLVIDRSGSMASPLSAKSDLNRIDAARALAILLREVCDTVEVLAFDNTVTVVPARRGFALADAIPGAQGGTFTEQAKLYADRLHYDRVIIVTDEQSHEVLTAPQGKGYVVNVASYQRGIGYGSWTHIDGWSEAVLNYVAAAEGIRGPSATQDD